MFRPGQCRPCNGRTGPPDHTGLFQLSVGKERNRATVGARGNSAFSSRDDMTSDIGQRADSTCSPLRTFMNTSQVPSGEIWEYGARSPHRLGTHGEPHRQRRWRRFTKMNDRHDRHCYANTIAATRRTARVYQAREPLPHGLVANPPLARHIASALQRSSGSFARQVFAADRALVA